MISVLRTVFATRYSTSKSFSRKAALVADDLMTGFLGIINEQQSMSGSIEILKVSRIIASLMISILSMPMSGRRIGIVATESIVAMFSTV